MPGRDPEPLRELLQRLFVRYLTVRPQGFELKKGAPPKPEIEARILGYGGARTLYLDRKPECRSLDGVQSITHRKRRCSECNLREQCTLQVRLDLLVDSQPYRLLLAYSSARSFLVYLAKLQARGIKLESPRHRIQVVDRKSFGELRFSTLD